MDKLCSGMSQIDRCFKNAHGIALADQWHTALDAPVILVVEDDWLLRQAILDELSAAGWSTREAESGETALEILESGESIDLLITDIRLGGEVDGWEIAEAFRAKDRDFPVIYVSANTPLEERRVQDSIFLTKPCVMTHLLEACKQLVSRPPRGHGGPDKGLLS